jgi:trans-aconitate methyltransferase
MKNYKWDAQEYEKYSQGQQKWARELIEKISLKGTENVLDLGCGDGKVTAEISKIVSKGSIIGVDNSAVMIDPLLTILEISAVTLPSPHPKSSTFSVPLSEIFSMSSLAHFC